MRLLLSLLAFTLSLFAQTPLAFDVAAIKPHPPGDGNSSTNTGNGTLTASNVSLRQLILNAYGIQAFQLEGGPAWMTDATWDIQARALSDAPPVEESKLTDPDRTLAREQMRERIRTLLADRFQLVVRRETREGSIYELLPAKSGHKLTEAKGGGPGGGGTSTRNRNGQFSATFTGVGMAQLAETLAGRTGRRVIDKTGLTGRYDFKLEWMADVGQPGAATNSNAEPGVTIFTALQEQGLRLESAKGPIEMIFVERAEKPSEN